MGKFIVFEGLDGSGKSTQISALEQELKARGEKVYVTAEPSKSKIGVQLRKMLSDCVETDMYFQAAMFAADRIEHNINEDFGIKKYLDDGYYVICDRYYYSSLAYQGTNKDCNFDWVLNLNIKCDRILKPDLCIFLDVNPTTCKERIDNTRDNIELYERNVLEMSNIRIGFMEVFKKLSEDYDEKIVIIDANESVENVTKEIIKHV